MLAAACRLISFSLVVVMAAGCSTGDDLAQQRTDGERSDTSVAVDTNAALTLAIVDAHESANPSLSADDGTTAKCHAQGIVDRLGAERLSELGVTTESISAGSDPISQELPWGEVGATRADTDAVGAALAACMHPEWRDDLIDGGQSVAFADCVVRLVTENDIAAEVSEDYLYGGLAEPWGIQREWNFCNEMALAAE